MTDEERKEIVRLRLENSKYAVEAAEVLIERELWSSAVNRMYYGCYYAVAALLIKNGIETNTHAGVRQMLNLHFVKTGKLSKEMGQYYSNIFAQRQDSDYDDYSIIDENLVHKLSPRMYEFIETIQNLTEQL